MKKIQLLLLGFLLIPSFIFSQKLKWVKQAPTYIDLVDRLQNIYIASDAYGVQDIDPGPGVVNINVNVEGSYFVKYDSLFNIQWVKTSPAPAHGYRNTIITDNDKNELFVLMNDIIDYAKNATDYYITKRLQDGTLIFKKMAFKLETGFGGIYVDMLDIFTDTSSNIWISATVSGKISFGTTGIIDTIPMAMPFIAKFNKDGDFLKVIKRVPDKYFSRNYRRTNYRLDTLGTIHQSIFENNTYYYLTSDTSGTYTKIKIFDTQNENAVITHLILADSGSFFIAGTFRDVFDFDNSAKNRFLTPKGTSDIFIAKYNKTGGLIDVWQMGGNGNIYMSDNMILKNNYLVVGPVSDGISVIDFDLGRDTFNVTINHSLIFACYDMSVHVNIDSIQPGDLNEDQVADINKGLKGSYPMYLVNFRDTLFFVADNGVSGYELWKSDGTQIGTKLIKDLTPAGSSFNPRLHINTNYPIIANNKYLFIIPDTLVNINTLWVTEGDSLTFTQISDKLIYNKFILNNKLYASKDSESYLITDGTIGGTEIKNYSINNQNLNFKHIVNEDSVIYLTSYKGEMTDLYKFNGENFTLISAINKPIYGLEKLNDRFYFYELNTSYNIVPKRLCSVNANGSDYQVIADFSNNLARTDEAFFFIKKVGNTIIFLGIDAINDRELWTTDGSIQNTHIIKDVNPSGSLNVNNMVLSDNGILFFSADDGHGNDIYQTNGTFEGTNRLRGLNPFGRVNYNSMAIVNDILYFGATNDDTGSELWKYKFVTNIGVEEGKRTYSPDSLYFTCELNTTLVPVDATDTSLTFTVLDTSKYITSIDSIGNLNVKLKSNLKAALLKDTIRINIQANDGSKTSLEYKLVVMPDDNTSVTGASNNNIWSVWPNPTLNSINIKSEADYTVSISITDILGRTLLNRSYSNVRLIELDLSTLPKGLLLLKIQSKNNSKTIKIVHQ
jgi:ELWxxDGT repeat protein